MFYNCVCDSEGGAIFFSSVNLCFKMIGANNCSCGPSSPKYGHFAYHKTSQLCNLVYQSVSSCSHSIDGSGSLFIV